MKPNAPYKEDLAFVHHTGFGGFSQSAAPELLRIFRARGVRAGVLVDLGCGSGLWARLAQQAGFSVIGIDSSPAMIRLAKKVSPASRFQCASLHDFVLPACAGVTIIGEGLNYLPPDGHSAPRLDRLFQRVRDALCPGGLLVFDVMVNEGASMNHRIWREGKGWVVLVDFSENRPLNLLTRTIVTFRRLDGRWRRAGEVHRVLLYSRAEIISKLRKLGFTVRAARGYENFTLPPRRLAFIARKPFTARGH
jgi:SAM-dependent methyltransferase